jgi:serine/threonine protein kinase/WD40 repeat protein
VAEVPPASADWRLAGIQPGTVIGGYRLEERIGAGAVAVVFRARDEALGRSVALKVLAPALALAMDKEEFRTRFVRESRAASLVDHPNIIPVYGAGADAGVLYLAMRYVAGGDLHSVVKREGPLPPRRAMSLLAPVASALDAAHGARIVHRDVKPANVLVDTGRGRPEHPYLSDFGLAKGEMMASGLTNAGEFVGTPGFASPEQISGRAAGPATDQYALACVAFTLLTASPPFRHRHPDAILWSQMSQPPPRVTPRRPDLPVATDEVLARALARDPSERFPACGDFVDALDWAMAGGGRPRSPHPGTGAPVGRRAADQRKSAPRVSSASAGPGVRHPSLPLPELAAVKEPATSQEPPGRRIRRSRIAAAAGSAGVIAAAATAFLLTAVDHHAVGAPGQGPKVSAALVATMLAPNGAGVLSVAFQSAGMLRVIGTDDTAYTLAVPSGKAAAAADLPGVNAGPGTAVLFSPDGEDTVVREKCNGGSADCYFVFPQNNPKMNSQINSIPGSAFAIGDATLAFTGPEADEVGLWSLRTFAPPVVLSAPDHRPLSAVAISADGLTAAALSAGGTSHQVYVWDTASQTAVSVPQTTVGASPEPDSGAEVPLAVAGQTLAVSDGATTTVYDLGSRRAVTRVPGILLALSPDGRLVATTGQDGAASVDLSSTETGQSLATLDDPGSLGGLSAVAFSADGRSVAVGDGAGHAYVWHLTGSV